MSRVFLHLCKFMIFMKRILSRQAKGCELCNVSHTEWIASWVRTLSPESSSALHIVLFSSLYWAPVSSSKRIPTHCTLLTLTLSAIVSQVGLIVATWLQPMALPVLWQYWQYSTQNKLFKVSRKIDYTWHRLKPLSSKWFWTGREIHQDVLLGQDVFLGTGPQWKKLWSWGS